MTGTGELHDCILLLILGAAAVSDLKFLRIGNRLLLAGMAAATLTHMAEPALPETGALTAGLLYEMVMLWMFAHHMTGGGDVKLNALILYTKPDGTGLRILVFGLLLGAVFGSGKLLMTGMWRERIRYIKRYMQRNTGEGSFAYYLRERDGSGPVIPMAVFLFAAACLIILGS